MAACVPRLVISLLMLEREKDAGFQALSHRCQALLPPAAASVWAAYQGENISYGEDGFSVMLSLFLRHGDEEQIARLSALAEALSTAKLYETAKRIMEEEHWWAAFETFRRIPVDAPEVTAEFWKNVGVCLYHLQEWESASECFDRATVLGGETKEISSYRQWMKGIINS